MDHPAQVTQQCTRELEKPPTLSTSERARALELSKYFQAAGIKGNASTQHNQGIRHPPDATLMALAQLGCFRLNTKWAYVSLLDCDTQFIISEATQSISVSNPGQHDPDDGLFLGFSAHPLSFGVCPETIKIFTSDTNAPAITTSNITADKTRYVIRDFRENEDFRTRPYVEGWPHMRSYAEVPLTSASGYVLGSFCVIDNKPRDFGNAEISTLREVAATVMDHLELNKGKFERNRAERLVRGLSSYLEHGSDSPRPHPGYVSTAAIAAPRHLRRTAVRSVASGAKSDLESASSYNPTAVTPTPGSHVSTPATSPMRTDSTSGTGASDYFSQSDDYRPAQATNKPPSPSDVGAASNSNDTFARAGELLRQALDLEGLAFLDAGFYDGAKSQTTPLARRNSLEPPSDASCGLLSYCGLDREDPDDFSMSSRYANFSRKLLYDMLDKHPFGHVFCFDKLGEVSSPDIRKSSKKSSQNRRAGNYGMQLTEDDPDGTNVAQQLSAYATPGSSIIFLPLWDFQQGRWFAAAVGWTGNSARVLERNDLSYLTAFGNSIMAEILNQQATALSAAKSDFIASISHELRSPLHGILASIELLRDTLHVTPEASTMLDNANACGSMLLDTMNHLLDFAKINRLTTNPNAEDEATANARLSTVNISDLVEEVVEGMYTSSLGQLRHAERDHLQSDEARTLEDTSKVVVLADIQTSANHMVRTEKGAWKRIVMNVLGNALKHTERGHILVRLKLVGSPAAGESFTDFKPHFYLRISDTGRGMSADFLEHKLFTPFMQENNLSPGTGLGLYIVQQLVRSLDGQIDVRSQPNVGTDISISIPLGVKTELQSSTMQPPTTDTPSTLDRECRLLDHRLSLVLPGERGNDTPRVDEPGNPGWDASPVSRTLTTITQGWLGMEVSRFDHVSYAGHVTDTEHMPVLSLISTQDDPALPWTLQLRRTSSDPLSDMDTVVVERRICHPFGPRKLSKAFLQILDPANASSTPSPEREALFDQQHLEQSPTQHIERMPTQALPGHKLNAATTEPELRPNTENLASEHRSPLESRHTAVPDTRRSHTVPMITPKTNRYQNLLLVDDNPINLRILASCVKKQGCTYKQATNGQEALDAYKSAPSTIDLIYMDLSMPVMDGCTSARMIRAFEREAGLSRCYIVALTALGSDVSKQQAFTSGIDAFCTKPISLKNIRELLAG